MISIDKKINKNKKIKRCQGVDIIWLLRIKQPRGKTANNLCERRTTFTILATCKINKICDGTSNWTKIINHT